MTFVGKILVVLQVVLSIFFMAFAGGVFAVQSNWRDRAGTLEQDNTDLRANLASLDEEFKQFKDDMNIELKQEEGRADDFEADNTALQRELGQEKTRLETAITERNTQEALATIAGEEAKERLLEALLQREQNASLHASLDDLINKVRVLQDEIFNKNRQSKQLIAKHRRMVNELADLKQKAFRLHIDLDTAVADRDHPPPPNVEGVVFNTKKSKRNGPELIEITVGSDDGLLKGHELFVYRTNGKGKYLGKIKLVYVTPDRAVGTVVLRAKNGVIQRGDNVTTKL